MVPARQDAQISLVSNTGETQSAVAIVGNFNSTFEFATSFHTGNNTNGYELSSVQLQINRQNTNVIPQVSIFSDSSGNVGTSLHTLINPSPLPSHSDSATELTTFTAPENVTLTADTTYWVIVEAVNPGSSVFYRMGITDSDDQASDDSTDWNIGNVMHRSLNNAAWAQQNSNAIQMNIQGKLIESGTLPDAPTSLTATAGNAQVALTWTAASDNGNAITKRQIRYKEERRRSLPRQLG